MGRGLQRKRALAFSLFHSENVSVFENRLYLERNYNDLNRKICWLIRKLGRLYTQGVGGKINLSHCEEENELLIHTNKHNFWGLINSYTTCKLTGSKLLRNKDINKHTTTSLLILYLLNGKKIKDGYLISQAHFSGEEIKLWKEYFVQFGIHIIIKNSCLLITKKNAEKFDKLIDWPRTYFIKNCKLEKKEINFLFHNYDLNKEELISFYKFIKLNNDKFKLITKRI